ncbi:Fic/DOC family protein [Chryseobacterium kwangjuense]|uniref:protein adenylyltransferase n=1 Tax=Chryseobacterium kwangjuense TaxID=267125 RepID=A0A135WJL5_9FLAO|nr:Fic family protein [Chryseobacterium kwangjuense]KXH85099.1 cell filamentation protein Fic [Chryseobacterium kwangjuense]
MKYRIPEGESEILSNKLGLKDPQDIAISEFEGFLQAEIILTENLHGRTRFNTKYIQKIHKMALSHLYNFAGKYRNVNLSKAGFHFSSAKHLEQSMKEFEDNILLKLPSSYSSRELLVTDVAKVHGELLFIHPFREGNGRTARILANLMVRKAGFSALEFEKIGEKEFEQYVFAVQSCAVKNYEPMIEFIGQILPS